MKKIIPITTVNKLNIIVDIILLMTKHISKIAFHQLVYLNVFFLKYIISLFLYLKYYIIDNCGTLNKSQLDNHCLKP